MSYFGLAEALSLQGRLRYNYVCSAPTVVAIFSKEDARRYGDLTSPRYTA